MQRAYAGLILLALACGARAQVSSQCPPASAGGMPVQPTLVAPLAPELAAPTHQLGAPTGVLAQAFDEALALDNVLLRQRIESCLALAKAMPATAPALPGSAGYKPQTQYDNTPWRFDMSQNGKRMTAEEFDAWMKARGVRVAKGAPATAAPTPVPAEQPKQPEKKK